MTIDTNSQQASLDHPTLQIPLQMLKAGQHARVGQLVGKSSQIQRLMELGFREGELLEVLQAGCPCIVRLAGTKLCFREAEALNVLVEPANEARSE